MCVCVFVQELHKQLDEVTQDAEIVAIRQKEAECELEATRDRVQQQATEILLKASEISPSISSTPETIHAYTPLCAGNRTHPQAFLLRSSKSDPRPIPQLRFRSSNLHSNSSTYQSASKPIFILVPAEKIDPRRLSVHHQKKEHRSTKDSQGHTTSCYLITRSI